ncbi:MAG: hypothetical protein O7C59_06470 [Rickettsia endosymbiont of Ixodes persulcatus]|nr:hypothetical protein [Rickettsia endosymbiont of Ixodes persulcatus]
MPTNETKNNLIEKSLAQLLRQLKEAKRREAAWGRYALHGDMEVLNDGIKALENILFASVDDFTSVKELIEIEQLFTQTYLLKRFYFPDYRHHINPALLTFAEIEVQLDTLEMKALDLDHRGHKSAATEVKSVVSNLRALNQWHFSEKKIDGYDYKARALQTINESRPVLETHRGYKQILGNLCLLILTAFLIFLINKACTGNFLFFNLTESAKQLNALGQTINTYPLQKLC